MDYSKFTYKYSSELPPLPDNEYQELKDNIKSYGIQIAIIVDEHNNVIDGQHRLKVASELKLEDVPLDIRFGLGEEEKKQLAIDINLRRRHLTKEQRKEWSVKLRQDGLTNQAIADKLGVDEGTIRNDLKSVSENSETQLPEKVIGKDGKQYPAKKPKSTPFPMKNYQATIYKPHPQDCCQTPPHALKPLYSFLNINQTIWEPASGEGYLAKDMEAKGFNVIASDILTQQNFFDFEPPNWDVLITNPPYHSGVLGQWIERCYSLGKPFALLMKLTTLGTKYGFEPFSKYGVELIIFDQRINFKMPNKGWDGSGAQFAACWFTWKLGLGQQITFMELEPDEKTT